MKLQQFLETELETYDSGDVAFHRRLWLWRRGFLSRSDAIYDLDDGHHQAYLTDFERFVRTPLINGTWNVTLTNKLIFHWLMERFDAQQTTIYGIVRNDRYMPIDTDRSDKRQVMATVGTNELTGSDTREGMLAPEGQSNNGGIPGQNGDLPADSQRSAAGS